MRYSIVIPAFKRSDLITKCLESIERQIAKPLEVIIVDNNSTDGSQKWIKENHPDVHLIGERCTVTEPESEGSQAEEEDSSSLILYIMGGAIALMLALIFVALVAKQMGARKRLSEIKNLQAQEMAFNNEEQERRQKWIEHYLATGQIEKAKELGYVEKAEWQVHMEQQEAEKNALPEFGDLLG